MTASWASQGIGLHRAPGYALTWLVFLSFTTGCGRLVVLDPPCTPNGPAACTEWPTAYGGEDGGLLGALPDGGAYSLDGGNTLQDAAVEEGGVIDDGGMRRDAHEGIDASSPTDAGALPDDDAGRGDAGLFDAGTPLDAGLPLPACALAFFLDVEPPGDVSAAVDVQLPALPGMRDDGGNLAIIEGTTVVPFVVLAASLDQMHLRLRPESLGAGRHRFVASVCEDAAWPGPHFEGVYDFQLSELADDVLSLSQCQSQTGGHSCALGSAPNMTPPPVVLENRSNCMTAPYGGSDAAVELPVTQVAGLYELTYDVRFRSRLHGFCGGTLNSNAGVTLRAGSTLIAVASLPLQGAFGCTFQMTSALAAPTLIMLPADTWLSLTSHAGDCAENKMTLADFTLLRRPAVGVVWGLEVSPPVP